MDFNESKHSTPTKQNSTTSFFKNLAKKERLFDQIQKLKEKATVSSKEVRLHSIRKAESKDNSQNIFIGDNSMILPDVNTQDKMFIRSSKMSLTPIKKITKKETENSFSRQETYSQSKSRVMTPVNPMFKKSETNILTIKEEDSVRILNPSLYLNDYIETEVYQDTDNSIQYPDLKVGKLRKLNKISLNSSKENLFPNQSYKHLGKDVINMNRKFISRNIKKDNDDSIKRFSFDKTFMRQSSEVKSKDKVNIPSTDFYNKNDEGFFKKNLIRLDSANKSPFVNKKMNIKLNNKQDEFIKLINTSFNTNMDNSKKDKYEMYSRNSSQVNSLKFKKIENLNLNLNTSFDPTPFKNDNLNTSTSQNLFFNKNKINNNLEKSTTHFELNSNSKSPNINARRPLNQSLLQCSFSLSGVNNSPSNNEEKKKGKLSIFRENEISILKSPNYKQSNQVKSESPVNTSPNNQNAPFKKDSTVNENNNINVNSYKNKLTFNRVTTKNNFNTKTLSFNKQTINYSNNLLNDTGDITTISQVQTNAYHHENEHCSFMPNMDCIEDIHFEFVKFCIKSKKLIKFQENGTSSSSNSDEYKTVISIGEISLD